MEARVTEEKAFYVIENPPHHPHDKFFRTVMSDKRVARDFLLAHLPPDILDVINLENLELQPRSFLNDVRKESIVDLLFKTTVSEQEAFIFVLVEHQSRPDVLMPFRMLKYMVNIIDDHLKQTKQKKLPLVYPMVVYHANEPYPHSADIIDIVDAPRSLAERYFLKPFHLIDLGQIEDEEIKKHAWSGITEFALKHIFARDMLPKIKEIANLMQRIALQGGENYIQTVLEYFIDRGEIQSKETFISLVKKEISTEIGEKVMTLREQFRIEGLQEGRQQGLQQGLQQGMQQGMQQGIEQEKHLIAQQLLAEKVNMAIIAKVTRLPLDRIKQLAEELH